jgi:hypothetical protein
MQKGGNKMKWIILSLLMSITTPAFACDDYEQEMCEWRQDRFIFLQAQEQKWREIRNATPVTDYRYPDIASLHQLTSDILEEWIETGIDNETN